MTTSLICNWVGASNTSCTYYIHEMPVTFSAGQSGNYIFAKLVNNLWFPIYIGQGDLADRISDQHHQMACILRKGATHVHVHTNSIEHHRLNEEADLLDNYPMAFAPIGCNQKGGG